MSARETSKIRGLNVKVKSFALNLGLYRHIGGEVEVDASRREIERRNVRVNITCSFFGREELTHEVLLIEIIPAMSNSSRNEKYTTVRHFHVGLRANPSVWPSGVQTVADVTVDGESRRFRTSKGEIIESH